MGVHAVHDAENQAHPYNALGGLLRAQHSPASRVQGAAQEATHLARVFCRHVHGATRVAQRQHQARCRLAHLLHDYRKLRGCLLGCFWQERR